MSRYTGPVVDAHHHFWQPGLGRQPWLRPEARIPFRYGDYESLKTDYLPPDMLRDAEGAGIRLVGTVTMETEWDESDPVGEMVYDEGLQRDHGLPTASVAHARLQDPDAAATLAALASHEIVRAVRQKPGQGPSASTPERTLLSDPDWQRGFARLADEGLDFELQTAWWQFDEARALFGRHPEVAVTLNHAGLPVDRTTEGLSAWRRALGWLADLPHVRVKISGIGVPGARWTPDLQRPVVDGVVEAFGIDRVMFASNFPVDGLTADYAEIYGSFVEIASDWSPDEQLAAFAGNAVRFYRLPERLLTA